MALCYHGVGISTAAEDPEFLRVPPKRFRAQVELLQSAGYEFMTVSDLADRLGSGAPPNGTAVLSFDDGWHDNHEVVLPLLQEYGISATVYVTTGLVGQVNPWTRDGARMMNADELRDLVKAGFEIGAHTVSHPDLSQLDREACLREMVDSRAELEQITGQRVRTFAYPYCKYGPEAISAAREAGFDAVVTCHGRGSWERFEIKRAAITGKDGLASFLLKVYDLYDPLFCSTPGLVVRDLTRGGRARTRRAMERRVR
ncbi:MAG: hypothetical protein NVSMB25_07770 [Thermoleophilaceae bacterium]